MIQPFHFWVFIQRKQNHYFDKISVLLYSLHHHCKTWKQPTYPLMDKWVQEMWYTHTHTHTQRTLFSHEKGNPTICNNIDEI